MKRYKTVDEFIDSAEQYQTELIQLRKILLGTALTEEVKWGAPCYTFGGKNIVGIGAFKSYFGLWFHQGALLKDDKKVLINAQEGKTKALRQWRMESKKEIKSGVIKAYVKEAIELSKAGKEIKPAVNQPLKIPAELTNALKGNQSAKLAFAKMTPGKQREYAEYISEAKRAETKLKRIAKIIPMIADNVGLNDKYRKC